MARWVKTNTGICGGNLKIRDHLKDSGTRKRMILKWILEKQNGKT